MALGEIHTVVLPLHVLTAVNADDIIRFMRAPSDAYGGGITVVGAYAVNAATTSGTPAFAVNLLKYSSAATPLLNGTVTTPIGGTAAADAWTADVPRTMPLGSDVFIDAGEWIALNYDTIDGGTPTSAAVTIHYQMGR